MKKLLLTILIISQFSFRPKTDKCNCPTNVWVTCTTPFQVHKFSDDKSVAITTPPDSTDSKIAFGEFGIYECGADTLTWFYGATQRCLVDFRYDTLFISQLNLLALGNGFDWVDTTWLIDKYYFQNGVLKTHSELPHHVSYNEMQIKQVLAKFRSTEWKTQLTIGSDEAADDMMQLANSLMIASISGNDTARSYFKQFNEKFKPDGDYNEMQDMIDIADSVTKRNNSNQE